MTLLFLDEVNKPLAMVVTEDGLAVVGTLKVNVDIRTLVNGDGREDGVLESKLTVPLKVEVAAKYCSVLVNLASDWLIAPSNVMMLVSICERNRAYQ